ncbi:hypothetical protein R3P38DRAFT_819339 [Favolaschia claudopus]|uniref:Uncharacterized protein n=1 Tax=Favolaschia claudopus TaxID=2862362 RepID=A0AAW0BW17_9AGAR
MSMANATPLKLDKTTRRLLSGKTPFFASTLDPRFSFSMYIPKDSSAKRAGGNPKRGGGHHSSSSSNADPETTTLALLVLVHGTRRHTAGFHTHLASFADTHRIALLTPLFPAGIDVDPDSDPLGMHGYKNIISPHTESIRYDLLVLSMISQAATLLARLAPAIHLQTDRFYLHGYSGGAQFAHRFMYLHPERLLGVSIAAPGAVTDPSSALNSDWPIGLANVSSLFPHTKTNNGVKWGEITSIPVLLLVGSEDTDTSALPHPNSHTGATRVERIHFLKNALEKRGVKRVEMVVLPGVGHEGGSNACLGDVGKWVVGLLDGLRTS